jgi:hypothetical protein
VLRIEALRDLELAGTLTGTGKDVDDVSSVMTTEEIKVRKKGGKEVYQQPPMRGKEKLVELSETQTIDFDHFLALALQSPAISSRDSKNMIKVRAN